MLKLRNLLVVLILWAGCKNEVEVAAPWKETVVVYGLLDPAASVNYLRIQKAYLDPDGNAFQFTGISDSIYNSNLKVKLYVRLNGNIIDSIFPTLVNGNDLGIEKDSGMFANEPNYLYQINKPIKDSKLSPNPEDYEYELIVQNPQTGYMCGAKAYTVGYLEPQAPVSSSTNFINIQDKTNSYLIISYREGRKAKAYDMIMTFWYKDINKNNPSDTVLRTVKWNLFKNKLTDPSLRGYELKITSVSGSLFYDLLENNIKVDTNLVRKAMYCDIEFFGAGVDLYTYVEVNKPSIGIVQKKPEYSNIDNGLGIFSSRYITRITKIPLSADMQVSLQNSVKTKALNFK
ncbi:MAG: hypothetical protein H6605_10500 [Flavobacteriales bacterium]|nr:hypothetical protein [Flavobacteriales bacterium]